MARTMIIAAVLAAALAVAAAGPAEAPATTSAPAPGQLIVVPEQWNDFKTKNPLCPSKLRSASATYNCYYKVVRELMNLAAKVDPRQPELAVLTMAPYLDPRIAGRTSAGEFTGIALSAEYFASAIPSFFALGGWTPINVFLNGFAAGVGPVAGFNVDFELTNPSLGININWTLVGFWRFDKDSNRVTHYDLDFRRFGEFVGALDLLSTTDFAKLIQAQSVEFICAQTMAICQGTNKQWASADECKVGLSKVPFVRPDGRTDSNSLLCRTIHGVLVRYDPVTHCPHVGPTGGSVCFNTPTLYQGYAKYYNSFGPTIFAQKKAEA